MKLRGWRGIVGQLVEERGGSVGWAREFTRRICLLLRRIVKDIIAQPIGGGRHG